MRPSRPTAALDWVLDKSLVLGWSKIGPSLRRHWWPADPPAGVLEGKHVVVTGASSGLGLAAAAALAGLGADVHLLGRNAERLEDAEGRIRRVHPDARLHSAVCDVSDVESVEDFCSSLTARIASLHALVHNAGVLPPKRTTTEQGHELTLATHVLGPHLMTFRLAELLRGGRVVIVSSGGMYGQALPVEDYEYAQGEYSGVKAYARTKRMQVVLAEQWATELSPPRHRRRLHAPRLVWHARPERGAARLRHGHGPDPAHDREQRRHHRLAECHPAGVAERALLAGPPTLVPPTTARCNKESEDDRRRFWEFVRSATGVPER